jgi:hypothetical protein
LKLRKLLAALIAAALFGGLITAAPAEARGARLFHVTVTVENVAPDEGNLLTPVWLGLHDGSFDVYDRGAPASPALERIAEDGNVAPLVEAFADSGAGQDGVAFGPGGPIFPGESATADFFVIAQPGENVYLSYTSMVIPSNDAFIANGNPTSHRIINKAGRFVGRDFLVRGRQVLDAGTEVNDEIPENTAALGQTVANTGVDEGGTVQRHPGLLPAGSGGIVDTEGFANADFSDPASRRVARVRIDAERVPMVVSGALSGDAEVPPVDTDAAGSARFVLRQDGTISYRIRASRIDNVVAGHIHAGEPGVNGGVLVNLIDEPPTGNRFNIRGTITDADIGGDYDDVVDLWIDMVLGKTYVNIHTTDVPSGELRADISG